MRLNWGKKEVKLRLKGGRAICSPDRTRTTVWKPPLTDSWFTGEKKKQEFWTKIWATEEAVALHQFVAKMLAKYIRISLLYSQKMAQKKWTPKRAKYAVVVVLKSSSIQPEKGEKWCFSPTSRQQTGLKAYLYIYIYIFLLPPNSPQCGTRTAILFLSPISSFCDGVVPFGVWRWREEIHLRHRGGHG